jgi:hypothetical protein
MIASKLAVIAPDRVLSLALLNNSGGGFECCPKVYSGEFHFTCYSNHNIIYSISVGSGGTVFGCAYE